MVSGTGIEPVRYFYRKILSLVRLPIPPPGHFPSWRPESELNRRTRSCSPLHDHSAIRPCIISPLRMERETRLELATPTLARLCSTTELFPRMNNNASYHNYGKPQHIIVIVVIFKAGYHIEDGNVTLA